MHTYTNHPHRDHADYTNMIEPSTRDRTPAVSLDEDWQFRTDPEGKGTANEWYDPDTGWPEARQVSVPHSWQEHADLRTYTGTAWYRTSFTFDGVDDERALLSFGAVDYETTVWVNGQRVGDNNGGYLPFNVDATAAVEPGENTIVLRVHDPEDMSEIPHGKQGADWYTRVSGPWQRIDLLRVPERRVTAARVTPDLSSDTATVELSVSDANRELTATVSVSSDDDTLSVDSVPVSDGTAEITLEIPDPDYWTPETPVLYDLRVTLADDEDILDTYETYFGMRSVDYEDGKLFLNGEEFTMRGALDQAFYPDTYYRPADLDTFELEIRAAKELGFNLLRKHIKPAHPEFIELADRMGILVWEEPANPKRYTDRSKKLFREQLFGMIDRDFNSPSVIAWSLYNEEWGIGYHEDETPLWDDTEKQDYLEWLYEETLEYDPTRLVCDNSGWAHVATDLNDYHEYFVAPDRLDAWRDRLDEITTDPAGNYGDARTDPETAPLVMSEFGTWGLSNVEDLLEHYDGPPHWFDHEFLDGLKRPGDVEAKFESSPSSAVFDSLSDLGEGWQTREMQSVEPIIADMRAHDGVAGYVITELTDIEWEFNGLLDYLRTEKNFYDDFARLNAPLMIHLEPSRHTAWCGETVAADLLVVNDHPSSRSITADIEGLGVETSLDVSVEGQDVVRVEDAVTIETPAVDSPTQVEITATAHELNQSVERSITVMPDDPPSLSVYTDLESLGDALSTRGYETVTDIDAADVSVVTDPEQGGGQTLVVPREDGHLVSTDWFEYTELPERESWNLCASFVYQDLFDGVDTVPGWAFEELYPYGYVSTLEDTDEVSIGYMEGWLENEGAISMVRPSADCAVCTLRVTDVYGEHPVGTAAVDRLLATLAEY